jgi:hypothetical protein
MWAFLWSYDSRNLVLALPLAGLAAGAGLDEVLSRLGTRLAWAWPAWAKRVPAAGTLQPGGDAPPVKGSARAARWNVGSLPAVVLLVPLLAILALAPLRYPDHELVRVALEKQKRIGDPELNALLYEHAGEEPRGFILTDYQMLVGLPGLCERFLLGYSNGMEYLGQVERSDVALALYSTEWCRPEVRAYFEHQLARGRIRRVFQHGSWNLVTTCRGRCR